MCVSLRHELKWHLPTVKKSSKRIRRVQETPGEDKQHEVKIRYWEQEWG